MLDAPHTGLATTPFVGHRPDAIGCAAALFSTRRALTYDVNMLMRIPTLVLGALVLTLWVVCLTVYPELPARIPMQFGLDGHVNRWAEKSVTSWFLMPAIATAVAALLVALAAYAPRKPEIYNYPGKEDVLKLTGEPRAAAIGVLQDFLVWTGTTIIAVFGATAFTIYRVAHERSATPALPIALVALILTIPISLAILSSRITKIVTAAASTRRPNKT